MQDKAFRPETRIVRRQDRSAVRKHRADLCVVGAGISGVSAAIEAARLGRDVRKVSQSWNSRSGFRLVCSP